MKKKIWYVTGASKGLGLALVKKLLEAGHKVAATSRSAASLQKAVGIKNQQRFLALEVNLSDAKSIDDSIIKAQSHFGGLDVIVNNAGYGISGSPEEFTIKEIRENFDVNVFATISVVQSVLPYFRKQHSGYIINISSISGFLPIAGLSVYTAGKFAVAGFTEALSLEVEELGIKATVVLPGAFRTDFLSDSSMYFPKNFIEEYKAVHAVRERLKTVDGKQPGSPEKAADALMALAEDPNPPVRVFLGSDAWTRAVDKTTQMQQALDQNKPMAFSTDFSDYN